MDKLSIPKVSLPAGSSEERMDPAIMSFLMQASIAAQTAKMRKLQESQIPVGSFSRNLSITDSLFTFTIALPWISFSITNLGPDDIYFKDNDLIGDITEMTPLVAGDSYDIDYKYPVVRRLYIQAASGGTATVKITALEGRPY